LPPFYPLRDVKALLKISHFQINSNAIQTAKDDFEWGPNEIVKCLLKLNDRDYASDRAKNHFHKTTAHSTIPNTKMDYYKMRNAPDGFKVYTHFYIRNFDGKLIITSFKDL